MDPYLLLSPEVVHRTKNRFEVDLNKDPRKPTLSGRSQRGLTILELVIAVFFVLIISALALPSLTKTLKAYQLNDAANQLAGVLKFTRFEAIRRNSPVSCINQQAAANGPANIWTDTNADTVEQPTEKQIVLNSSANLQPVIPNAAALAAAVGAGALTVVNPVAGNVAFDQRGAAVPPAVYVFYVGNTGPDGGFRAVIVLPSGSIQVWTYSGGGTPWQQLS
jgi:Tfp pilus assembly protein FimT